MSSSHSHNIISHMTVVNPFTESLSCLLQIKSPSKNTTICIQAGSDDHDADPQF